MLPHTGLRREQLSTINIRRVYRGCQLSDAGGKTIQVLDSVYAANYAVVKDGIYFIAQCREGRFAVLWVARSPLRNQPRIPGS